MKRLAVLVLAVLVLPGWMYAIDPDWKIQPVIAVDGIYGAMKTYTMTSDTAVTLQAAYTAAGGTWNSNGLPPIGYMIVCETNACRIGLGGTTPTVDNVGAQIATGGSAQFMAIGVADGTKITNSATGANAKYHITPIYQK